MWIGAPGQYRDRIEGESQLALRRRQPHLPVTQRNLGDLPVVDVEPDGEPSHDPAMVVPQGCAANAEPVKHSIRAADRGFRFQRLAGLKGSLPRPPFRVVRME